jgi:ParB/RepB/Spo0J family partition protein
MATTTARPDSPQTAASADGVVQLIDLDLIQTHRNVRELANEDIAALAGSIELLGQITPAIVRPIKDGQGFVLVAGHKRYAALRALGRTQIRAEVRSAEAEHSERAAENIVRGQLNPYEEARAVAAMLEDGYTQDGAAQALGWSKARVTARVKLLQLPEAAQRMIGDGRIALAGIDHLLAVGRVSPPLLDAVVAFMAQDGSERASSRVVREPAWVIGQALHAGELAGDVFAEALSHTNSYQLRELQLGKTADALLEQGAELQKQLDRYSASFEVEFADTEVDQARAAGVLIEFNSERSFPIICDRKLFRQLCRDALKRTISELEQQLVARDEDRKAERQARAQLPDTPADPVADAERTHRRRMTEISEDAHGANLDLGRGLLDGLSTVDPSDMRVARFFVSATLGSDRTAGGYGETGKLVHHLAVHGIRYVIGDFRHDVTKSRKDGSRGRLRIDYGDPRGAETAQPAVAWLWRYVDGAKTAGELYGRALVVIAAEHYATQLVVPGGQRGWGERWGSHKDQAIKALEKLAGPHVPASLKAIERAVKKADSDRARARAIATAQHQDAAPATPAVDDEIDHDVPGDETFDPEV